MGLHVVRSAERSADGIPSVCRSAENQPEVIFFTAISAILAGQVMTLKRLDKLAAIANVPTTKPGQPAPGVKPQP